MRRRRYIHTGRGIRMMSVKQVVRSGEARVEEGPYHGDVS
jgi:hypothetical protein